MAWEYQIVEVPPATHRHFVAGIEVALNVAGAEGWEAVLVFSSGAHVLMKRPINNDANDANDAESEPKK